MKKLILCFLIAINTVFLFAQESNSVAGGNASGSGGVLNYSIGQTFVNIASGTNGNAVEGVQQPYEISVVTAIENTNGITLECKVYPNPTSGLIRLIVKTDAFKNLKYELYNINGIRLLEDKVEGEDTEISLDNLPSSTYIMKIFSNKVSIKTFKIIKN